MRLGLNPFNWVWFPSGAYEPPTKFYPKRKTFALAWLGLQLYVDIDNGEQDLSPLVELMKSTPNWVEEDD